MSWRRAGVMCNICWLGVLWWCLLLGGGARRVESRWNNGLPSTNIRLDGWARLGY